VSPTDLAAALRAVRVALAEHGAGWRLREEVAADREFVDALYVALRWDELAPVPWPDAAKQAFLREQSRLQGGHYRAHYPGALLGVLEHDGLPVGRLCLHASPGEYRLMDIALVAEWRRQGLGQCMLRALMGVAAERGKQLTLHVESNNPAQRLYARLGFELREDRGVHHFLAWPPAQLNTAS
jgi:ribosomal protein S18 acetylase RimI-like enzyme